MCFQPRRNKPIAANKSQQPNRSEGKVDLRKRTRTSKQQEVIVEPLTVIKSTWTGKKWLIKCLSII